MRTISLALTHFNRFYLLQECITPVINDPRIAEIVISDDASTDDSWAQLNYAYGNHPKVKLFRNPQNLDCYANKRMAVMRATKGWVILFDSDNILSSSYLDTLYAIPDWNPSTVYLPTWAKPHFDYRAFSGKTITRANVAQHMALRHFTTALNTANYFFHRAIYLAAWDSSVNPVTADSIYMALRLLQQGRRLAFVDGLHYFHRVHDGSHYKQNVKRTGGFARLVEDQLKLLK